MWNYKIYISYLENFFPVCSLLEKCQNKWQDDPSLFANIRIDCELKQDTIF